MFAEQCLERGLGVAVMVGFVVVVVMMAAATTMVLPPKRVRSVCNLAFLLMQWDLGGC